MLHRKLVQVLLILATGATLIVAHDRGQALKHGGLSDLTYRLITGSGLNADNISPEDQESFETFRQTSATSSSDSIGTTATTANFAVPFNPSQCSVNSAYLSLQAELQSYQPVIQQIVQSATSGSFKGTTYRSLAEFVDTYPDRISGSDSLEASINYLQSQMGKQGLKNVRTENVPGVPAWKRGQEFAKLVSPIERDLDIVGLGSSASTSIFGLFADAVVFNSYTDLVANQTKANGKIVICNFGGPSYAPLDTVNNGYAEAVSNGARALLYRSATTFSLYSPHARRANLYYGSSKKVPIAYLTLEDSDLLSRISARGQKIHIYLSMQNSNGTRTSRNLFGDLVGRENPDEYLLLAGHTDSWDVGQGAQDDGFALYLALQGLSLLQSLNLTPRRTIRAAFWTAEEYGFLGAESYIQKHASEFSKLSVALEADYGCLYSTGLIYNGKYEIGCLLNEIMRLAGKNATYGLLYHANVYKSDLDLFQAAGVPVVSLNGDDGRYYYFHHSRADTMTAVNSGYLDQCLALWSAATYVLADLNQMLPRGFDLPLV